MSKRILTDVYGSEITQQNKDKIRIWGAHMLNEDDDFNGLYAVIIADDNLFEGL